MVREWCVLYILTSKCASCHNGVQFFISHLASWLRTRRFSEPTFRPTGATNHWKNTVNRDFPTFSHICIFFLLILSLLTLLTSAFQLSILSEVSLLNFLQLLLVLEVLIARVGSVRLRFARVPRVIGVCVSHGFRACCSARVPHLAAFKLLQERNILRRILLLLLLTIIKSILRLISFLLHLRNYY